MAKTLEDLYVRRLRLPEARERVETLRASLEEPSTVLVEIAHDGQIPHLGVVRMILKARQIAVMAQGGLAIYLVGDHYSAAMRPRNLYLGLPLRGVDADHVKTPITVSVGKRSKHIPFRWLPAPSREELDRIETRAEAWIGHNASHVAGSTAGAEVKRRLREQFEILRDSAICTASFGDWLIRNQVLWFDMMFDGPPDRLLILPMSGILEWLSGPLRELAVKVTTSGWRRSANRLRPGAKNEILEGRELGFFWIYCGSCFRRHRAEFDGFRFRGFCTHCGTPLEADWSDRLRRLMPDIAFYESALFRAGIAGWIVGSHAPYHPEIERLYRRVYSVEMPPKFYLTSVPRFRGLGEPPQGHTRARLFRVMLELAAPEVKAALEVPWATDPVLASPYVSPEAR